MSLSFTHVPAYGIIFFSLFWNGRKISHWLDIIFSYCSHLLIDILNIFYPSSCDWHNREHQGLKCLWNLDVKFSGVGVGKTPGAWNTLTAVLRDHHLWLLGNVQCQWLNSELQPFDLSPRSSPFGRVLAEYSIFYCVSFSNLNIFLCSCLVCEVSTLKIYQVTVCFVFVLLGPHLEMPRGYSWLFTQELFLVCSRSHVWC